MVRNCLVAAVFAIAFSAFTAESVTRSIAEVDKLIATDGATTPPWFDSVKLNFPPTLNLTWEKPKQKEPWTPSKYISQYVWSVINENPGRWREGLKLLYHVYDLNKNDAEKSVTSMRAIARNYQFLQQDPARAAYWWKKSGIEKSDDPSDEVDLANCYFALGNKEFPRKLLNDIGKDESRHGETIKLWADIGDYDKALSVAKIKIEEDSNPDIGYLMAGETCRMMGNYKDAISHFEKVIAMDDNKAGRDIKQSKNRARGSLEAVKLYESLDLTKIPDGTYLADSTGYSGNIFLSVTVKAKKIEAIKVVKHTEKQYYGSLTDTPAKIISKQSVKGIDSFSGATITSEAIINATAKALAKAVK